METKIQEKPKLFQQGTNREAILILHGFAVDIRDTDLLFKYFVGKGYTVERPILPGHTGELDDLKSFGPTDWLADIEPRLTKLEATHDRVYILGISFGSNLAVALASNGNHPKVAGIVVSEMPIFFSFKMWLSANVVQPLYQFFGIEFISKDSRLYRKNRTSRSGAFAFVPVRVAGQIRDFVKSRTMKEFAKLTMPVLVLQAEKSDLLNSQKIRHFICNNLPPEQREIYCLPINNHDLNILDDEGKVMMFEHIYNFIRMRS